MDPPTMSLRELAVLIEYLPITSMTKQRLAGNKSGRYWDEQTHLIADVVNILQTQLGMFYAANFKGKPPKLNEVPRPEFEGDTPVERFDPRAVEYLNSYR